MKIFRWKAIGSVLLVLVLVTVLWLLFIDHIVRRSIEIAGAEVVGAKVEPASARLRLRRGDLLLSGLQVADPNAPMRNLVEIPTIEASLNRRALGLKKVVVESLVVHGVRFGTPRQTSGALAHPSPTTGLITRRLLDWADKLPIPRLDLGSIVGAVVRIPAINADSLRTNRQARHIVTAGDSLRGAWNTELQALDPRPTADSARALADRLKAADPRRMTPVQIAASANDVRTMIARVTALRARLDTARAHTASGLATVRADVAGLDDARRADLTFVRGLVHVPSFEAPDVSMSLFGTMVKEKLKPLLYWVNVAEQYVPPGLDPRRQQGPKRLRRAGTTFVFPLRETWPDFLVERTAADLAIGGRTVAAGAYAAEVHGVTTEPAVYGRPMTFTASRASSVGPRELRVGGSVDRTGAVPRDSVHALVPSVRVPPFAIPNAGATLDLGDSATVEISMARNGAAMSGTWHLLSNAVHWNRTGAAPAGPPPAMGTQAWAEDLVWRAVASVPDVDVVAHLDGPVTAPNVTVSSNIGDAVAGSIQRVMGAEIAKAEAQVRAKVDSLVSRQVADARAKLATLQAQVTEKVEAPAQQLEQLEAELKDQLTRITQTVPGVRLPGGISLPRPRP